MSDRNFKDAFERLRDAKFECDFDEIPPLPKGVDNALRRWLIASVAAFRLAAQDSTPNREETP